MVYRMYSAARWCYLHKLTPLSILIKGAIRILFAAVIPYQARIGKGCRFGYQALGVVIHKNCVVGANCRISQGVTLGGTPRNGVSDPGVPRLGDNVYLGAGVKVIGDVTVGDNCVIGANSVALEDIPANSMAAGIPARVIKTNIDASNYI